MQKNTRVIPFTDEALRWHLVNNIMGLKDHAIKNIVATCNKVNSGEMQLDDGILPGSQITVAELLDDMKIEYNRIEEFP